MSRSTLWGSLLVACGGSDGAEPSDPTCEDVGADVPLEGTVAAARDACVVSTTAPTETLSSFIAGVTPLGQRETLVHERCYGVDDNASYDFVVHTYDVTQDTWTQDDAIFDGGGNMVWLATSHQGTDDCCATYCCDDVPVSGSGSGTPVALRDCVLVSEQRR